MVLFAANHRIHPRWWYSCILNTAVSNHLQVVDHCRPSTDTVALPFSLRQIYGVSLLCYPQTYMMPWFGWEAIHFETGDRTELFNTQISNISILIACNVYAWNLWHAFRLRSSNKFEYVENSSYREIGRVEWHWFSECLHSIWLALPSLNARRRIRYDSISTRIYCCRLSVCFHWCAHNVPSSERTSLWCTNACMLFVHRCAQFKWVNAMQKNKLRILMAVCDDLETSWFVSRLWLCRCCCCSL